MPENFVEYHLNQIVERLKGASPEQLTVFNQWAAVALDRYHQNSSAIFEFIIDNKNRECNLCWNSNFPKAAMREEVKIAEDGGVSLAFFVMSVLLGYRYVQQSEIGEGVDYGFQINTPDPENFFKDCHHVEISGLLEERGGNTLASRVKYKHGQIDKGSRKNDPSSVIVTHFKKPITVKEIHR